MSDIENEQPLAIDPGEDPGMRTAEPVESPEDKAEREAREATGLDEHGNEALSGEDITAQIAAEIEQAAQEKAARLAAFEAQYPENIRAIARKLAEQRGADADAALSTRDGEFEWGWVAYAEQAVELAALVGGEG